MQKAPVVKATIYGKVRDNPNELFARISGREFYFVQRDERDRDSSLYFDFLMHTFNPDWGTRAEGPEVELKTYGRRAVVIAPPAFLEVYKENALYWIDTNEPEIASDLWSHWGNEGWMRNVKGINAFLGNPLGIIMKENLRMKQDGDSFPVEYYRYGIAGAVEKVYFGEEGLGDRRFDKRVHLVINPSDEGVFVAEKDIRDVADRIRGYNCKFRRFNIPYSKQGEFDPSTSWQREVIEVK